MKGSKQDRLRHIKGRGNNTIQILEICWGRALECYSRLLLLRRIIKLDLCSRSGLFRLKMLLLRWVSFRWSACFKAAWWKVTCLGKKKIQHMTDMAFYKNEKRPHPKARNLVAFLEGNYSGSLQSFLALLPHLSVTNGCWHLVTPSKYHYLFCAYCIWWIWYFVHLTN